MNNGINKKKDIICFGEDWYSSSMGITKQVMRYFINKGHRVIWINPIPYRMPQIRTKAFKRRFVHKLKSHMKIFKRVSEKQVIFCPLYIPLINNEQILKFNRLILNLQLKIIRTILNVSDALYWGTGYTINDVLDQTKSSRFVYNFCDKYSSHRGISNTLKAKLERKDEELIEQADILLCSSEKIFEYVLGKTDDESKIIYFPHGVDFDHFNKANNLMCPVPKDIAGLKHPIIGYFGTLGGGFNKDIIKYCATERPLWSFVLIGTLGAENDELRELNNVYLLGPKPYEDIPSYGRCFDVCLMTWIPHEWADYCFPIKTLEYLAMGKPVVSIPIEEITRHYSDVVSVAGDNEKFLRCIEHELMHDSEAHRLIRIEKVRNQTWENIIESVYTLITEG